MVYNSCLRGLKPDVLKSLFAIYGGDEQIPELAKDGSLKPLEKHLNEYGKTLKIGNDGSVTHRFTPKHGINIWFDHQINSDGDDRLEMSVFQIANFIRGCVRDGSWKEPDDD